jgi:agmatine deiminase
MEEKQAGSDAAETPSFRLPAEWEPHERTVMAWPARPDLWGDYLEWARRDTAEIANTIAQFEPVLMVARPGAGEAAERQCGSRVEVVEFPIDDSWIRDNGPVVVVDSEGNRVGRHFRFNAWGEKYHPYLADASVAELLLEHLGIERTLVPVVLENGSISSDGAGTFLTTAQCNLNTNRNGVTSAAAVAETMQTWLGCERLIWLPRGLEEDRDTDGHVDNVAAFAPLNTVIAQTVRNERNPNFHALSENTRLLAKFGFQVLSIDHLPYSELGGKTSPVPYLNFYVCNGGVIVPVTGFDAGADAAALEVLREAFPGRRVVGVPGAVLAYGGGGAHCITLQIPASATEALGGDSSAEASAPGVLAHSTVSTIRSLGTLPSPAAGTRPRVRPAMRVGVIQHAFDPDRAALEQTLSEMVQHAAAEGAELVCLPELFLDPYRALSPDSWDSAEHGEPFPNGPSHEWMVRLARHTRTVLAGTIHTASPEGGLGSNTSVIVDASGDTIWRAPKMHLPNTAGYHEDQWFRPGRSFADPVSVGATRVAQPVCWDEWFPEVARLYRLRGAEVLLYPSAIGSEPEFPEFDTQPLWQQVILGHAIANGLHMVVANRVGCETHSGTTVEFFGSSFIADPYGRVLASAPRDEPAVLVADLDLNAGDDWLALFPLLSSRRPELYGDLAVPES